MAMSTSHTLKIGGDPVIPGLALPDAFESLDKRLESTVQLCKLKGSFESQTLGVITICQELQRILKFAFIENGMLASRIEILTRYQNETIRKLEKKLAQTETEHKVTRKHMKRLRKRITAHETFHKKPGQWWDVDVRSSDYDSLMMLSRMNGNVDLEFMLRINQLMVDFVNDTEKKELVLPPMGHEERQELAKLASVYKLRCRYGKSVQVASSTLFKARQISMPAPGEVDAVLENFTKQKRPIVEESGEDTQVPGKESANHEYDDSPPQEIPSTMLTPLSTAPQTIELLTPTATSSKTPLPSSPTSSGLATPTDGPNKQLKSSELALGGPSKDTIGETPLPSSLKTRAEHLKIGSLYGDQSSRSNSLMAVTSLSQRLGPQQKPPPLILTPPSITSSSKASGSGGLFLQQIRPVAQPTVVASPLKMPISQLSQHLSGAASKKEGEGRKDSSSSGFQPPPKRARVTRRSVEEEHSKT